LTGNTKMHPFFFDKHHKKCRRLWKYMHRFSLEINMKTTTTTPSSKNNRSGNSSNRRLTKLMNGNGRRMKRRRPRRILMPLKLHGY